MINYKNNKNMNTKLISMMVVAMGISISSHGASIQPTMIQATDNDTLIVNNPRKVTVITDDSLQTIRIEGRNDDPNFHYENTIQLVDSNYVSGLTVNSDRWDFSLPIGERRHGKKTENECTTHLGFGWCNALGGPDNMDIAMGSSWEIFWTIMQWNYTPKGGHHIWSTGIGVDWRNYRMKGHWRFDKLPDDNVVIVPYSSEDVHNQFSRIKVFSLQVPLLYRYRIGHGFSLSAGTMLNLNLHSSLKTRYKLNGDKYKDTCNGAQANPVTVDFMGIISTPAVSLYVKYSPCNVLKSAHAPKFQSLSVGIYL